MQTTSNTRQCRMQSGGTYSPGLTGFGASGDIIILPGGPSADNLWKLYVREFMLYIISDHTAVTLSEIAPTPTITVSGAALLGIHVGMDYYWFCSSCFPFLLSQLYYRESMYSQFSLQVVLVSICECLGCGSPISKSGFEVQRTPLHWTLWYNSYGNQLRGEIVVGGGAG